MNAKAPTTETNHSSQDSLKRSSADSDKGPTQKSTSRKRKAAGSRSPQVNKGIAMVKFDSQTKMLNFNKRFIVNNEVAFTNTIAISLSDLSEVDRQFVIALIKHTVSYCNGNNEVIDSMKKLVRGKTPANVIDSKPSDSGDSNETVSKEPEATESVVRKND